MAEELTATLTRRAERGTPRGATAVLEEARHIASDGGKKQAWWRTGPAVAFATATVMLAAVAVVLAATRLIGSDDTSSPVAPDTTIAAVEIAVDELTWFRVPSDVAVFGDARIVSVTVLEDQLVASGENRDGLPVLWTSPDGLVWTSVSLSPASGPHAWTGAMSEVTPGGPGLVAVVAGTVWSSPDMVNWRPAAQTEGGRIASIARGGPGLVAVGHERVYVSADGVEWTRGQCPGCSAGDSFGHLTGVVAGGPGLVAVGNATDAGEGPSYIWTSPDGLTWTLGIQDEWVELEGIATAGPGFVAVGHHDGSARVLTSVDGVTWSPVPDDPDAFGGSLMRRVIAVGNQLVALGEWEGAEAQAWTSLDGVTWDRRTFDPSSLQMADAVFFDDKIIAVGTSMDGGAVWIAAEDESFMPPTSAPESDSPGVVTGENVNPWRTTEITEPWARDVVDVAVLPEGGFAVASRYGGGVFWSRDGVTWDDANPNGRAALPIWPDDDNLRVITALPGQLAVLDSSKPVVWVGDLATGEWDSFALEWRDAVPFFDRMVIASSDVEILVAGRYWDGNDFEERTLVWLIDPDTGSVDRSTLPGEFADPTNTGRWNYYGLEAAWFGDRWVLAAGNSTAVSEDGRTWATNRDEDGLASGDRGIASLTAGFEGLMAVSCEWAHRTWLSEDGLTWTEISAVPAGHYGAYSDALGFVVVRERVFTSGDGAAWDWTLGPQLDHSIIDTAASGSSVFILTKTHSTAAVPFIMTLDQTGG